MPLYNAPKNKGNLTLTKANNTGAQRFEKNKARVSKHPSTTLQRKIRSDEFNRVRYAYNKYESRINSLPQQSGLMPTHSYSIEEVLLALESYATVSNTLFFGKKNLPAAEFLKLLTELEVVIFPMISNVFNHREGGALRYEVNAGDIVKQLKVGVAGRKQFIFFSGNSHAIYIDTFKDDSNRISVITIDSLNDGMGWGADFADELVEKLNSFGTLSILNLHTDAQKSAQDCHFFSLHFARKAINDPVLIAQHILNIENAKQLKEHSCHVLNERETEQVLNIDYYKHAQSSTRLNLMSAEKKSQLLSDGKTLLQHHADFKVKKISAGKAFLYSNSIDFFRRKQIELAVRYYQECIK